MEKITLIGMFNYDATLFDNLRVPAGINKDILIDSILMRGGEFETLYASPIFIKRAIGSWSNKWYNTFLKWLEAVTVEFSPIENYDRYEDYTDISSSHIEEKVDSTDTKTYDSSNTVTDTTTSTRSGGNTTTNTRSSFDSGEYQPHDKSEIVYNDETVENGGNVITSNTGDDKIHTNGTTRGDTNGTLTHTAHLHGNIGVTESTAMAQNYINFYGDNNIYEIITDIFLKDFVIAVY